MASLARLVCFAIALLAPLRGAEAGVVEISSAEALREAIENPRVNHVRVNRSIALRAYNGWAEPAKFPVSMVVEVKEQWQGEVVIDVDGLMTIGSVAGMDPDLAIEWNFLDVGSPGLNITFLRVVITGAQMAEIKQPPTSRVSLNIENCTIVADGDTPSPQVDLQSVVTIGHEIRSQNRKAAKNSSSLGVVDISKSSECEELFGLMDMRCIPKRSQYLGDWGVELGGGGVMVAAHSLLTYRHALTLRIDEDNNMEKALSRVEAAMDSVDGVTLIIATDLIRQDFAPLCPLILKKNIILRGESPMMPPSTKIHLDDIEECFVVQNGRMLVFRDMIVTNIRAPSSDGTFSLKEFMPFVRVEEGGQFNMDNVVYKNSVRLSAEELTRGFFSRPRMEHSGTPGGSEQEVQEMEADWCQQTALENCAGDLDCEEAFRCPDSATFITDVAFDIPGENGRISFHFCNTLVPAAVRKLQSQFSQDAHESGSDPLLSKKTTKLLVIILACCTFMAILMLGAFQVGFIRGKIKNREATADVELCQELDTNKCIQCPREFPDIVSMSGGAPARV